MQKSVINKIKERDEIFDSIKEKQIKLDKLQEEANCVKEQMSYLWHGKAKLDTEIEALELK